MAVSEAVQESTTPHEAVAAGVEALAEWAAAVRWEDIPDKVRRRAALILCDDLAAIIAARGEPEIVQLQDQLVRQSGRVNEATVFRGGRDRVDRYSAAVANAAAADWTELDEGYRRVICHAGLYTVPALLAEAEAEGLRTEEMIRALAVSYEIAGRFARTFVFPGLALHPHAYLAAVGAAAAIAVARRLPAKHLLDAVTAASTAVAPGPYNHAVLGALVRNVWPAVGAWTGMRCVDWAGFGIAGLPRSPYDVFVEGLGAEARPGQLTDGLGREWAVEEGYHKVHACCQYSHSAVEATLDLLRRLPEGQRAENVEIIRVETHWRGLTLDNYEPATTLAAKFSMPHIAAVAGLFGHAGADAFAATTLRDPAISAFRRKVGLAPFAPEPAWPNDRPARVTWRFPGGAEAQAECLSARGGPDRPFTTEEILDKITGIATPVYPDLAAVARRVVQLEAATLRQSWTDLVHEITSPAR